MAAVPNVTPRNDSRRATEGVGTYMAYANLAVCVANGVAPPIFGLILNFHGTPTP